MWLRTSLAPIALKIPAGSTTEYKAMFQNTPPISSMPSATPCRRSHTIRVPTMITLTTNAPKMTYHIMLTTPVELSSTRALPMSKSIQNVITISKAC
ncbi:hypothetical protein CXF42_05540 [Corynebacterium bovis]|uniref:Uncharacterized protein n=1 Tax=Corynebacterium bovis TaxID=36808 RepID=A0A3R8PFQ3_9CORY|nr:hypothetical protein CXF39_05200 [Corynebacterium bovis]RRQ04010.1 hypothetical protein CXF42_05540 [Corynebacterium bovis]